MTTHFDPSRTAIICIDQQDNIDGGRLLGQDKVEFNTTSRAQTNFVNFLSRHMAATVMVGIKQATHGSKVLDGWYDNKNLVARKSSDPGSRPHSFNFSNPEFMNYNVCLKDYASAANGTGVPELLHEKNIDTVILIGNFKSKCIFSSALDFNECGFKTILVPDLIYADPAYIWDTPELSYTLEDYKDTMTFMDTSPLFHRIHSTEILQRFKPSAQNIIKPATQAGFKASF